MVPLKTLFFVTVPEDSAPTPLEIAAPSDPTYPASQLTITVVELPEDGVILLADGVTHVGLGMVLTVGQLTGLLFQPNNGVVGTSSTFAYTVADPSQLIGAGIVTLAIASNAQTLTTTDRTLTISPNSGAVAMGISAPTDSNYSASQLSVTVTGLPSDGTVLLPDGVTAVTTGQVLTVAQLTGLLFEPAAGMSNASSAFTYSVSDPSGLSAPGTATLVIAADTAPPVTSDPTLTVAPNSGAVAMGISAPTDSSY